MHLLVGFRIIITRHWKLLTLSFLMFLTLCSLGTWQVARLHQKEQLIENLHQALQALPVNLTPQLKPSQFTKVQLEGHFAPIPPLLLKFKPFEGKIGQYVVSPFLTNSNQWILILRGWTEEDLQAPDDFDILLQGQVRFTKPTQWFEPKNTPGGWVRIDPQTMGQALGISFAPFYILEESPPPPIQALPQQPSIPNNHLAYIVTWFGLAFALCVMVIFYIRKDVSRGRTNNNT